MTTNEFKQIKKPVIEHNDPSSEVVIKATHYPPGYPENKSQEEKHRNSHPMHCHHMQPMQSATIASVIDTTPDHVQQDSKK
jgi:hypothetical protein